MIWKLIFLWLITSLAQSIVTRTGMAVGHQGNTQSFGDLLAGSFRNGLNWSVFEA